MIGGAPLIGGRQQQLNVKAHKEYAAAMAAGQNAPRPYPVAYVAEEGGKWNVPCAVKFSDGSIYDTGTKSWRPARVDPIEQWERNKAADPLASSGMIQAGEHLVREVKELRQRVSYLGKGTLDGDDDDRDF